MITTIADVLTQMLSLNNELDVVAGGTDETRAIAAVNLAKFYIETVAATLPRVLSARGVETIKTAAQIESTPLPENLLRIDRLWLLDSTSGLPTMPLEPIDDVGGHQPSVPWPISATISPSLGQISAYYLDGEHLYWSPIPDAIYEVRVYGLWHREDFLDRTSAWTFPQSLAPAIAAFAVKYCLTATGDDLGAIEKQAREFFAPSLRALKNRDRSVPKSRHYERVHTT